MSKNLDITLLLDFYGDMLSEKQREFISYYYNDDLSLAEIATDEGITRQGVRDAIKRGEAQLVAMEEKLGLVARFEDMKEGLGEIIRLSDEIAEQNSDCDVEKRAEKIGAVARMLLEEQ